jgi:hypothetical protein
LISFSSELGISFLSSFFVLPLSFSSHFLHILSFFFSLRFFSSFFFRLQDVSSKGELAGPQIFLSFLVLDLHLLPLFLNALVFHVIEFLHFSLELVVGGFGDLDSKQINTWLHISELVLSLQISDMSLLTGVLVKVVVFVDPGHHIRLPFIS